MLALGPGVTVGADPQGPSASYPLPDFVDIAEETGLDFTCGGWSKNTGSDPTYFIDLFHCTSPVVADFNGNGYLDVFFPNMRHTQEVLNEENDPQNRLYVNNGDGTFTDATDIIGLRDDAMTMGAVALDYDGDGHLDIYTVNFVEIPRGFNNINSPSSSFYHNHGDGSFSMEVPQGLQTGGIFGEADAQWGMSAAVADYDGDGHLDVFRGNWARYKMTDGMPPGVHATQPDSNILYRNNGDNTFTDVTAGSGASAFESRSFGAAFTDFTGDNRPDLYVANDQNPNEFYRNQGSGVLDEESLQSGADDNRGSMCAQAADWSGDGNQDLFMTHYENQLNGYYVGNGDGTFTDEGTLGDLETVGEYVGWACPAVDIDNDGDLDLFLGNGHMLPTGSQFPGNSMKYEQPNLLFLNTLRETGTHSFEDISADAGPGLQDVFVSGGAEAADFDLDGRAEIVVVNSNNAPVSLYKNQAPVLGNWISIEPRAAAANTHAIGAKVTLTAGTLEQVAHRQTGGGYGGGSVLPLRFGLGAHTGPVDVKIEWPDGTTTQDTLDAVNMPAVIHQDDGVRLDTLAPGVDVNIDGVLGANGWWTSPTLTVNLDAHDRGIGATSGVQEVSYRLGDGPVQPYTGPIDISGEGLHDLIVYATDHAGNSAWYPHRIKIDSIAPQSAIQRPVQGMIYIQDREQGESPTGDTIIVTPARTPNEEADNMDDLTSGTITSINDMTGSNLPGPPVTLGQALDETVGSDPYTRVIAGASDATSGMDRVVFHLDGELQRTDSIEAYSWDADLRGLPPGEYALSITATDRAGLSTHGALVVQVVPSSHDAVLNTLMGPLNDEGGD